MMALQIINMQAASAGEAVEAVMPLGAGTQKDPYQISSPENLQWMFENTSKNKYYLQTSNIDFLDSSGSHLSISNNNYRFSGTYDGNGLSIKNYTGSTALFPENWGFIQNVGLVNVNVQSDSFEAGPLVGVNVGYITSCYATGSIAGRNYVGGLVGSNSSYSVIENSYSLCSISGNGSSPALAGGLVGYNYANATVQSCYSAATMMNNIDRFGSIAAVNERGDLIDVFSAVTSIHGETDYYFAAILYAPYNIRGYFHSSSMNFKSLDTFKAPNRWVNYFSWDFDYVWSIDSDGIISDGFPYLKNSQFTKVKITYHPNGATSGAVPIDANIYTPSSPFTALSNTGDLKRNSMVFSGWNTKPDGSGTTYMPGATGVVGFGDLVLYAKWETASYDFLPVENQSLQPLIVGYESGMQQTLTITLTNGGNMPLENIKVQGVASENSTPQRFVVSPLTKTTIGLGESTTFTVRAIDGLDVGKHVVTILFWTSETFPRTFNVTQTVQEKIALTVEGLEVEPKVYDKNADAVILTENIHLSGVLPGDDVSITQISNKGVFTDVNAGAHVVSLPSISLTGKDAWKYSLIQPTLTGSILPKTLSIEGVVTEPKVFDNTTDATGNVFGGTLVGVLDGDDVTLNSSNITALFEDSLVGSDKPITITGYILEGEHRNNYVLLQPVFAIGDIIPFTQAYIKVSIESVTSNGQSYNGEWTSHSVVVQLAVEGLFDIKNFQYSNDNGITWTDTSSTFVVDKTTDESYIFRAIGMDDFPSQSTSSLNVKVDKTPPVISNFKGNLTEPTNKQQKISFEVTDGKSGIDEASILVKKGDEIIPFVKEGSVFSFTTTGNGDYSIVAFDLAGNIITETFQFSSLDLEKPRAVGYYPENGALHFTDTYFTITFDENIRKSDLLGDILVTTDDGVLVERIPIQSLNVKISGNVLSIYYTGILQENTSYSIRIDKGVIVDLAGNPVEDDSYLDFWTFTTGDGFIWGEAVDFEVTDGYEVSFLAAPSKTNSREYHASTNLQVPIKLKIKNPTNASISYLYSPDNDLYIQREADGYLIGPADFSKSSFVAIAMVYCRGIEREYTIHINFQAQIYGRVETNNIEAEVDGNWTTHFSSYDQFTNGGWEKDEVELVLAVSENEDSISSAARQAFLNNALEMDLGLLFEIGLKEINYNKNTEKPLYHSLNPITIKLYIPEEIRGGYQYTAVQYYGEEVRRLETELESYIDSSYIIFSTDSLGQFAIKYYNTDRIPPVISDFAGIPTEPTYEPHTVSCEISDRENDIFYASISVLKDNQPIPFTVEADTVIFTVSGNGEYAVFVSDIVGNTASSTFYVDVFDEQKPNIVSLYPSNGACDVTGQYFAITFDENMKKSDLQGNIAIYKEDGLLVEKIPVHSLNVRINENVLTVHFGFDLEPDTQYYVSMDKGVIVDRAGNEIDDSSFPDSWSFKTAPSGIEGKILQINITSLYGTVAATPSQINPNVFYASLNHTSYMDLKIITSPYADGLQVRGYKSYAEPLVPTEIGTYRIYFDYNIEDLLMFTIETSSNGIQTDYRLYINTKAPIPVETMTDNFDTPISFVDLSNSFTSYDDYVDGDSYEYLAIVVGNGDSVSHEEMRAFEAEAFGADLDLFFHISLKELNKTKNTEKNVHHMPNAATVRIHLPEHMLGGYRYSVLHYYNGAVRVLDTEFEADYGYIQFKTEFLGQFAIRYYKTDIFPPIITDFKGIPTEPTDRPHTVSFQVYDNETGIDEDSISISKDGEAISFQKENDTVTFEINGNGRYTVFVADVMCNAAESTFNISLYGPQKTKIVSYYPIIGQEGVTRSYLTICFDKNVKKSPLQGDITITRADGSLFERIPIHSNNVRINKNIIDIYYTCELEEDTQYVVNIDKGVIVDFEGNDIDEFSYPEPWTFKTASSGLEERIFKIEIIAPSATFQAFQSETAANYYFANISDISDFSVNIIRSKSIDSLEVTAYFGTADGVEIHEQPAPDYFEVILPPGFPPANQPDYVLSFISMYIRITSNGNEETYRLIVTLGDNVSIETESNNLESEISLNDLSYSLSASVDLEKNELIEHLVTFAGNEDTISSDAMQALERVCDGKKLGLFVDIGLKKINITQNTETNIYFLHNPAEVKIYLPEHMKGFKEYTILYYNNGVVRALKTKHTMTETGEEFLTAKTDRLGQFAVSYIDQPEPLVISPIINGVAAARAKILTSSLGGEAPVLIFAAYKDGKRIDMKITDEAKIVGDYTEYNINLTNVPNGATVKAFLWKSLASMIPLADAKQE